MAGYKFLIYWMQSHIESIYIKRMFYTITDYEINVRHLLNIKAIIIICFATFIYICVKYIMNRLIHLPYLLIPTIVPYSFSQSTFSCDIDAIVATYVLYFHNNDIFLSSVNNFLRNLTIVKF